MYYFIFLKQMIRAADTDKSGVVEFNEFMEMMADTTEVNKSDILMQ